MPREIYLSNAPWENIVGYSRACKIGNIIEVSGTTAVQDGKVIGLGNYFEQTKCILEKIQLSLNHFGVDMKSVIRTRIYVVDITQWEQVAAAHQLFFKEIKPATSMVEVSALIDKELLVEIEATAIVEY